MTRQIIGARDIPQEEVLVNGITFRINNLGDFEILDDANRICLDLEKLGIKRSRSNIGLVQILPLDDKIKLYVSNYDKPGALLSYNFNKNKFDLELTGRINTRFWTLGLLCDRNEKGIAIGSGDEQGVRLLDFNKCTLEEITGSEEIDKELKYSFFTLFQNPPQIEDGKFYISHLDFQGNFLCHQKTIGTSMVNQMVKNIRRKLKDPKLERSLEICIDDEMMKKGYKSELDSIKEDVAKSYFLYGFSKQPPSQVIIISEGIADYVRRKMSEKQHASH